MSNPQTGILKSTSKFQGIEEWNGGGEDGGEGMNLAGRGLCFSREAESSRVSSLENMTQASGGW